MLPQKIHPADIGQSDIEILSAIHPVPSNSRAATASVSEYCPTSSELSYNVPHLVTQSDFDDLVREAKISKENAELFASRLKQWNLVASDFKVTSARKRAKTT